MSHINASSEVSYPIVSTVTNEASGLSSSKVSPNKTINVELEKVCWGAFNGYCVRQGFLALRGREKSMTRDLIF